MKKYDYYVVGCASNIAPTLVYVAFVSCPNEEVLSIPESIPFVGEWGNSFTDFIMEDSLHPLPKAIHIIYLSLIEEKFYIINKQLPLEKISHLWQSGLYSKINVGMAPYGGLAIWVNGLLKSSMVDWLHGNEIKIDTASFIPDNPNIKLNELCANLIENSRLAKKYRMDYGLPPYGLFNNYMKQFTYRYFISLEKWNADNCIWIKYKENEIMPLFDYIEEKLSDGTHDKLHDGGLMKYHEAGKPKKLAIKWHINKSEYSAYFWFDEDGIKTVFDKFYGSHPDTKADFIIRIDAENQKYELALYRYGLKEPQIIPEEVYQLIVFKNKFEDYRSDNYNQESGAWIW